MKNFLILAVAVFWTAMGAQAQTKSINFIEGKTLDELKEMAKKENKLIFLDFYTSWCKPCKVMDREVYVNDTVADFYNSHFINVKIDAGKDESKDLRKEYRIFFFPTFLFISPDGQIQNIDYGFRPPGQFVRLGADALDPKKQFSRMKLKTDELAKPDSVLCRLSFVGVDLNFNDFLLQSFRVIEDSGYQLLPDSRRALDGVIEQMRKDTAMTVIIVGYVSDAKHAFIKEYLERVSGEWAEAASRYLVSKRVASNRLAVMTDIRYGEIKPVRNKSGKSKAQIKLAENQQYMGVEVRNSRVIKK